MFMVAHELDVLCGDMSNISTLLLTVACRHPSRTCLPASGWVWWSTATCEAYKATRQLAHVQRHHQSPSLHSTHADTAVQVQQSAWQPWVLELLPCWCCRMRSASRPASRHACAACCKLARCSAGRTSNAPHAINASAESLRGCNALPAAPSCCGPEGALLHVWRGW